MLGMEKKKQRKKAHKQHNEQHLTNKFFLDMDMFWFFLGFLWYKHICFHLFPFVWRQTFEYELDSILFRTKYETLVNLISKYTIELVTGSL